MTAKPRHLLARLGLAALALSLCAVAADARALELGPRRVEVTSAIDIRAAMKLSQEILKFNDSGTAPIYLLLAASGGTAQGVLLVADTVRSIESPVVAVVMTPLSGAGAALALTADQVLMLPSAELHFTEVDYEGIPKKDPPKPDAPAEEPAAATQREFQQGVRAAYLKRFWAFVAKRANEPEAALVKAVEERGGFVLTAEQALRKKVIAEVITRIAQSRVADEKTEIKATTTRTVTRTAPAPSEDANVR